MAKPFEVRKEIEVSATPEQIWEAIGTGPGIDNWYVGVGNRIESREGGTVELVFGGETGHDTITHWEPPRHLRYTSEPAPDGSLHAFEYTIEARAGDRTMVRIVHSGFLADDWEAEYDALNEGDYMYLHLMAQYVEHFGGRPISALVSLWRPEERGRDHSLATLRGALGLGDTVVEGAPARFELDGLGTIDGVVDFVSPSIVGFRTDDALYRFLYSPQKVMYLGHHIYREGADAEQLQGVWQAWLDRTFA